VRVNREFVGMFGYLQEEIVGKTVVSFIVTEEFCKEAERFADFGSPSPLADCESDLLCRSDRC
jgi:PAS domain S-box-containing protein